MALQAISDKLSPLRNRFRRLTQDKEDNVTITGSDVNKHGGAPTCSEQQQTSKAETVEPSTQNIDEHTAKPADKNKRIKSNPQNPKQDQSITGRTRSARGQSSSTVKIISSTPTGTGQGTSKEKENSEPRPPAFQKGQDNTKVKGSLATTARKTRLAQEGKKTSTYDSQESVNISSAVSEDESYPCDGCGKAEAEYLIQCERCDKWICNTCESIDEDMMELLKEWKQLHWFCSTCEETAMGAVKDSNSNIQYDATFKKQMTSAMQNVQQLMEEVIKNSKVQKHETYAAAVKSPTRVLADQTNVQPAVKETQYAVEVVDEYIDRERRKCNLIVHNVPEPEEREKSEIMKKDCATIQEIVTNAIKITDTKVIKTTRLGRKTESATRPRLLLVVLEDESMKRRILGQAKTLRRNDKWGNIFISPDQTPQEREKSKKLREELKRRRAAGETNIIIKRGIIVTDQSKNELRQANLNTATAQTQHTSLQTQDPQLSPQDRSPRRPNTVPVQ